MEHYFNKITPSKRKTPSPSSSTTNAGNSLPIPQRTSNFTTPLNVINLDDLPSDPSERRPILSYNANQRDEIRRRYLSLLYPNDFTEADRRDLAQQLDFYIDVVKEDDRFSNLSGIAELSKVMVETRKHVSYYLVYRLVKLALVLPVATATVERCFSAMKFVKSDLRNRIGDEFLNSSLICAIEKEELSKVETEVVIQSFRAMALRRGEL